MFNYKQVRDSQVTPYAIRYIGIVTAINVVGGLVVMSLMTSLATALIGLVLAIVIMFVNVFLLFLNIADMCNEIIE